MASSRRSSARIFRAPPITSKAGRILYGITVPIYWTIAYVIAAAIPDYFAFVSIVAAFCILQFSYTFPPMIHLVYSMQMNGGGTFDPATGQTTRSHHGVGRYVHGFFARYWYWNVWHVIYTGGCLVTAGLGAYVAIVAMKEAFAAAPQSNAYTCTSPFQEAF